MIKYELTKQAFRSLKKLTKSDPKTAKRIKQTIGDLRLDPTKGEALQGYTKFKKVRIGKYRLIHSVQDGVLWIVIIEKRETVYLTFEHFFKNAKF